MLPAPEQVGADLRAEFRALVRAGFVAKTYRAAVPFRFSYAADGAVGSFAVTYHADAVYVSAGFRATTSTKTDHFGGEIVLVNVASSPRGNTPKFTKRAPLVAFCRKVIGKLILAAKVARRIEEF